MHRDPHADGAFVYAVRTTGVYCHPSCASRKARRENVSFYRSSKDAERAGFRPCLRCRPHELPAPKKHAEAIEAACRALDRANEMPALVDLAAIADLSPFHFHRLFRSRTGLTPKGYFKARQARRMRKELSESNTVTEAIYAVGFSSSSRFYENSKNMLGMKPRTFAIGGKDTRIRFAVGESSLGPVLVAATDEGICAIELDDDPEKLVRNLQDRFPKAILVGNDEEFERWVAKVVALVESPRIGLDLPLDVRGTVFQQKVWQALQAIPAGTTITYANLAALIGASGAARAVARACAANPIALAIPCHRVIRTDGNLSGYRWGVERKRQLLAREALPGNADC